MGRFAALVVLTGGVLAGGCSSNSSTGTCCISVNGSQAAWTCPTQAAFEACCGGSDTATDGCLTDPTASPQNTCTSVSYANNCND